jgi:hypothetical protein
VVVIDGLVVGDVEECPHQRVDGIRGPRRDRGLVATEVLRHCLAHDRGQADTTPARVEPQFVVLGG